MGRDDDANALIARFGGQSALARVLGVNQSTVQHWSKTGHVPSWRREQIERAAQQQGVALGRRTEARPMMGYGRASASPGHAPPVQTPLVHGRADTIVHPDKEMGALRDEIAQLRSLVEQLVEAVAELKAAAEPKRPAAKAQRASPKPTSRSKSPRS
jgi:hypothetical protein